MISAARSSNSAAAPVAAWGRRPTQRLLVSAWTRVRSGRRRDTALPGLERIALASGSLPGGELPPASRRPLSLTSKHVDGGLLVEREADHIGLEPKTFPRLSRGMKSILGVSDHLGARSHEIARSARSRSPSRERASGLIHSS